jgi:hypothetical protein
MVFVLILGLGLPGMALAGETDIWYSEFDNERAIDNDTNEDIEDLPPSDSEAEVLSPGTSEDTEDTGPSPLADSEDVEVSPPGTSDYTAVVSSGADNLVIPLNTKSAGSEDNNAGDWVLDWDGQYYPWIEIVDGSGEQVSDANVEVSWSGPFTINWRRSGKIILSDGRLLIQQVEPANWRAIEPGTLAFTYRQVPANR